MKSFSNCRMHSVLFAFAFAVCCSGVEAQDEVLTETRRVPQLTASTPLKVRIRQKSGITASGSLISLTEEMVKFRTPRSKEVEISIAKISNIRTVDGTLDYSPGREPFADLVARVNEIPGLSAGTTTIEVPVEPKSADSASDPDGDNTTAPSPDGFPPVLDPAGTAPVEDPAQMDPDDTARTVPGPFGVIFSCESCKKDLPATIKDGERCPHCGIVIFNGTRPTIPPPTAAANPPGTPPAAVRNPPPAGVGAANAPAAPRTTTVTQSPGASFSDAPMWMKVGLFVGMLAVAWVIFQRR